MFQSPFPLIFIGIMSGHPHLSTSSWVNVPPCLFRGSKHSLRRGSSAHRNEEMGKSLKGHKGPIICIHYICSTYINIYIYTHICRGTNIPSQRALLKMIFILQGGHTSGWFQNPFRGFKLMEMNCNGFFRGHLFDSSGG